MKFMEERITRLIIVMILCLIPAGMVFGNNPDLEFGKRVAYAVCVYLILLLPLWSIIRLADSNYRSNASTSDIIERWMDIVVFPISYIVLRNYFDGLSDIGPVGLAWCSFLAAITISGITGAVIKFFVRNY